MKKLFIMLSAAMFSSFFAKAQVTSSAYNLTLKALLSHTVPEVSVAQVKELKGVLVLDAREQNEYEVSHIANAKFVGYDQFNIEELKGIDPNQEIVVYCSVGYRSEKVAEKIIAAGFNDVSNLYGGIFEWVNQDNLVVDSHGKATANIHAYSKTWGVWLNKGNKVYDPK
jgi:rhodanese-related sulfurtransferase